MTDPLHPVYNIGVFDIYVEVNKVAVMRIQELRKNAGLTQMELATSLGLIQSMISDWERELYLPKARDLPRLAKILGCTINDLFVAEGPCGGFEEG